MTVDTKRMRELLEMMRKQSSFQEYLTAVMAMDEFRIQIPALLDEVERLRALVRTYRDDICGCSSEVRAEIIDGRIVERGSYACEVCEETNAILGRANDQQRAD